ncbi:Amino acid permease [uncultured archaeon]|nr:Amino acid permease [uncultured archaeon]
MKKPAPGLSLFDAVNIALGAIVGAGIFVIIGAAARVSGPAVFISVLIAAAVAALTGLTSAELSSRYQKSGGAYLFARETISEFAGFLVGWVWLFSNVIAGATVAVGFGYYLAFFFPFIPSNMGAALAVITFTGINLLGVRESSKLNDVLVMVKIAILLFFVAVAAFYFKPANFQPLAPFGIEGVLAGAATIFFAYAGFARVAMVADDIKDAARTVPRATLLSILISTVLYALVAFAAVGMAGYQMLSNSGSPLADAMQSKGLAFGAVLVALGALIATSTVTMSGILGLSRLAQSMARDRELPALIGKDDGNGVPRNSILISGAAMLAFAFFADLPHIAYIGSFSLLLYYAATNLSGIKITGGRTRYIAVAGLLSCIVLMVSLPLLSWIVGIGVVALGIAYYAIGKRK